MNKSELIDAIASKTGLTKTDSKKALDAITSSIAETLQSDSKVALVGFGTFSVSKRVAREGRNPQTGAAIKIAAKKVAKFKAGADLDAKVN